MRLALATIIILTGCASRNVRIEQRDGGAVVNGVPVDGTVTYGPYADDGPGTVEYGVIECDDGFLKKGSRTAIIDRR